MKKSEATGVNLNRILTLSSIFFLFIHFKDDFQLTDATYNQIK